MPAPDIIHTLIRCFEENRASTHRRIGHLIYQLYGLTDKEIAIVESSYAPSHPKSYFDFGGSWRRSSINR